jgi:hypothetical protein
VWREVRRVVRWCSQKKVAVGARWAGLARGVVARECVGVCLLDKRDLRRVRDLA